MFPFPVASLCFRGVGAHELVEVAVLAVLGRLLVEQRQALFFELLEELIPPDLLQRAFAAVAGKIDAEQAGVVAPAGAADARRRAVSLLHPPADLAVVGRRAGFVLARRPARRTFVMGGTGRGGGFLLRHRLPPCSQRLKRP